MNSLLDHALFNAAVATVLALVVGGIGLIYRRPALLHCLWLLVLLKLVTPAIFPVSIPVPNLVKVDRQDGRTPDTNNSESTKPEAPTTHNLVDERIDVAAVDWVVDVDPSLATPAVSSRTPNVSSASTISVRDTIAVAWLTGSLVWGAWTLYHLVWFQRLLRHGRPASRQLQEKVKRLAGTMGINSPPPILLVPGAVSPMIWAFGTAPRLIFPSRLLDRLEDEQLDALLIHELAHVRRRDHWVRGLEFVVTALFWWHPVLWWAKREIHEAEELCCDAWVVWASAGGSRVYALALVQAVEFCTQARAVLPAAASGIGPVPHLRRRLTMIMLGTTPRSLSWAGACAVLGLGLLLPLAPVQAQAPPDDDVDEAAAPDDRDQQIEVLKRAIRALEDQKKGDKPGQSNRPKADPADIEKAKKEVERREREVNQKRNDLHEAEHRLHEAKNRLRFTEGKPALPGEVTQEGRIHLDVRPVITQRPERRIIQLAPDGKPGGEMRVIGVQADGKAEHRVIRVQPDGKPGEQGRVRVHTEVGPDWHGKMDMEQRLQRLLQEVEEIRREMRRQQPRPEARPRTPPGVPSPRTPAPLRPGARVEVETPVIAPGELPPGGFRVRVVPPKPVTPPPPPIAGAPPGAGPLPPTPGTPPVTPPPVDGDSDTQPVPPPPAADPATPPPPANPPAPPKPDDDGGSPAGRI